MWYTGCVKKTKRPPIQIERRFGQTPDRTPRDTEPVDQVDGLEQRETREKEPVDVARLFLFQSRRAEDIRDDEDIETMHFTEMLLIQKGGDVNPGQVMPIGGKIDEGENPLQAAMREAVEEAHLRPAERSVRPVGIQEYSFEHSRKGELHRRAHYFKGKLGPQDWDVPYPLHPTEDKIARFVRFSPVEAEQLLVTHGTLERDGEAFVMQDALNPNERLRIAKGTGTSDYEREMITDNITLHHALTDARKKMMIVLELLMDVHRDDLSEQGRAFLASVDTIEEVDLVYDRYRDIVGFEGMTWDEAEMVLPVADEIWKRYAMNFTVNDIRLAFIRSDHGAKFSASFTYKRNEFDTFDIAYDESTGEGVPTAALIFPLLLNDHVRPDQKPDYRRIKNLQRNPTMRQLIRMTARMKKLLRENPNIDDATVIAEMHAAGYIEMPRKTYDDMSLEIDIYFEELRNAAGLTDEEAPIDQLDEIKLASLTDLFRFASSSPEHIIASQPRVNTLEEAKVFAWEAQRKLVLLILLNDAVNAAEELKERTTGPIDIAQTRALIDLDSPLRLYAGTYVHKKRPDGTKELMSLLRKMIVRDKAVRMDPNPSEVVQDYFAESYVFDDIPAETVVSHDFAVPPICQDRITDTKGNVLETVHAPKVMMDLMVSLLQQDPGIRIVNFKPFPPSGKPIDSKGGGGGGKVRFGKFYIEHTEEAGMKRYKEIQVFIPDPVAGLTGAQEFERKKQDDREYGVRRLFKDKGIRSFMEKMFPAIIYDDFDEQIRGIFHRAG